MSCSFFLISTQICRRIRQMAGLAHSVPGLGHPRAGAASRRARRRCSASSGMVAAAASRSASLRGDLRGEGRRLARRAPPFSVAASAATALKSASSRFTSAPGLRPLHLPEDEVLPPPDLPLHPFDLAEHRRVLLVGLYLHQLALVLRALPLEVLHRAPSTLRAFCLAASDAFAASSRASGPARGAPRPPCGGGAPRGEVRFEALEFGLGVGGDGRASRGQRSWASRRVTGARWRGHLTPLGSGTTAQGEWAWKDSNLRLAGYEPAVLTS